MLKKLGEPQFSYVSIKTTRVPAKAKAGGTCLILNEFAIMMRHEKCDFKNWTLRKISQKSKNIVTYKVGYQQPAVSIKPMISDLAR